MTPKPCRYCGRPIRWVGGFRLPMEAEGAYFVVEPEGLETAHTVRGDTLRGHFGPVIPGQPWTVAYRPHHCTPQPEVAP